MLQTMRHWAQHWFLKGLMLFLVISFAIWGIGDIFRGNPLQRTVAKSGSVSLSVQALDKQFEDELAHARQMLGPDLTAQQARQIGILDNTLQNMIARAGLDQMIAKQGIDVPDSAVLDMLAAQPQLRDKDGKFNSDLFHRLLDQTHLSEHAFLIQTRQDLARKQLLNPITEINSLPHTITDNVYKARGQKRILEVISLKNDSISDTTTPDDKALEDFYHKNPDKFTAPEYRAITLAKLSTDDVAKDIAVSDDELKKAYADKAAELTMPEQRDVLQVVLQDEVKAQDLAKEAGASHDLKAAAKKIGYEVVPLNDLTEKTILPELTASVFALSQGQVSTPIKSSLGWHVVQLTKITPGGKLDFDAAKQQLGDEIKRDRATEVTTHTLNQLDDALAAGHSLEDIADSLRLRLIKIPAIDTAGKLSDGKDPQELPSKDDVLKTAFGQGSGETSPVIDDRNGNFIVVRTDEITPSQVRPLDAIKEQVAIEWRAGDQAKKAEDQAQTIASSLREGKTASSFAAHSGVDVRLSKPISLLGDSDPGLPTSLLPQILLMKKGDVITEKLPDHQLILRLTEIDDVDPASDETGLHKVSDQLTSQIPAELTDEFARYLRIIFPVEIDQSLMESLRQQGS